MLANRTVLYDYHKAHATIGEFGGFEMPLWYEGIVQEVHAVRNSAGIFDVSHMGRIIFTGRDAGRFLDHIMTNDMSGMDVLQTRYALICNEEGGVVDDTIVFRTGEESYVAFWNASNRQKDNSWAMGRIGAYDVRMEDRSDSTFMIALQGPMAERVLQPMCGIDLSVFKRHKGAFTNIAGRECYLTRTGYTGEDGFELFSLSGDGGPQLWDRLICGGAKPAGLGARDVLRLEAGLPLYGHELSDTINPIQAGLGFAVRMDKADFIGRSALSMAVRDPPLKRLVGLRMVGRGIPRQGYAVLSRGLEVGVVTSGTFSPTLNEPIALALVEGSLQNGTEVQVRIRGADHGAKISGTPFYDLSLFGFRRKAISP
jgi:aminomethyltransferase